ncbi:hypothetical protein [Pseudomonas fluorescens]|uniref:hypothetical protein n=1 Tax=Pseudomonas fluorescens TaxID=294 RepID=UPI00285FB129|nr:hypothetical protein [Pseudomonas fluorescens]MDR6162715.1 hypothetical protein [Pseudomonas fluorescens]
MNSDLLNERVKSLLAHKGNAAGFFYAEASDGRTIVTSEINITSIDSYQIFAVKDPQNYLFLEFPLSVVGDGPHEVEPPNSVRFWRLTLDGVIYVLEGVAVFTLRDDRNTLHGVVDFVIEGGVRVVGGFYIRRK